MVKPLEYEATTPIITQQMPSKAPVYETAAQLFGGVSDFAFKQIKKEQQDKLLAEKYVAEGDLATGINKLYNESLNLTPEKGAALFQKTSKSFIDKALEASDPRLKAILTRTSARYISNANTKLQTRIFEQNKKDRAFQFRQTYTQLYNNMSNDALHGTAESVISATHDHANLVNMVKDAERTGLMTPREASLYHQQAQQGFIENKILGQYQFAKTPEQKNKFKKDFENSTEYNDIFSPSDKQQMMHKFEAIDKQHAAENGYDAATYKQKTDEVKWKALHGERIDASELSNLQSVAPKKFDKLLNDVKLNTDIYNEYNAFQYGSLDTIKAKKANLDASEPKTYRESIVNQKVSQMLDQKMKLMQEDPAEATYQDPSYQSIIANPDKKKNITDRAVMLNFQKQHGYSENQLSVLTNTEAHVEANRIRSLPIEEQANAIGDYLKQFSPDVGHYAMRDLQRAGLSQGSQYSYRISQADDLRIRKLNQDAVIAFSKLNDKDGGINHYEPTLKIKGTTPTKLMNNVYLSDSYLNYANSLYSLKDDFSDGLSDRAERQQILAAQLMSRGYTEDAAVEAAGNALNAGVGFTSYRGNVIRYPSAKLTSRRIKSAINYMMEQATDAELAIPPHVYEHLPYFFRKEYVPSMLLVTGGAYTSTDSRRVILTDNSGSPIRTKTGEEFSVSFKDLENPSSDISTKIDEFEREREQDFYKKHQIPTSVYDIFPKTVLNVLRENSISGSLRGEK